MQTEIKEIKDLLYSQQKPNIALAEVIAESFGFNLKNRIQSWGLHKFGIAEPEDFEKTTITSRNSFLQSLEPLRGLAAIKCLIIEGNPYIRNLSPLSELLSLEVLDFARCAVSDLSPISSLRNLKKIQCGANYIKDLTPLLCLPNLELVSCWGESDIKGVCELKEKGVEVKY